MASLKENVRNYLVPEVEETITENRKLRSRLKEIEDSGALLPMAVQFAKMQEAAPDLFRKLVTAQDYLEELPEYTDALRLADVNNSYQSYYTNPTVSGVVDRYLDYGLGRQVTVVSSSNPDIVTETMSSIRNSSVFGIKFFRDMGVDFIAEGELMYVCWYDEATKLTSISRLPTKNLQILWKDPITKKIPLVYILPTDEGDIVYRDWRTLDEELDTVLSDNEGYIYADEMESNTLDLKHVSVWAVGGKRHVTTGRGMPLLNVIMKNSDYLAQFDDQRAAVSAQSATYAEGYTIQGGSTALNDFINRESGEVPAFGSSFVGNQQVEREWNNNPTGANAERYNQHILLQGIASATSLNGAILGVPSMLSNRSVLDKLMEIFIQYIEGFQNIIADTMRDVFNVVVIISSNPALFGTPELFDPSLNEQRLELVVSLDTPVSVDIIQAISFVQQQYAVIDKLTPEEAVKLKQLEKTIYLKFGVS